MDLGALTLDLYDRSKHSATRSWLDMNGASEAEGVKSQGFELLDVDMDQADDDAPVAGHGHPAQCTCLLLTTQLWKAG